MTDQVPYFSGDVMFSLVTDPKYGLEFGEDYEMIVTRHSAVEGEFESIVFLEWGDDDSDRSVSDWIPSSLLEVSDDQNECDCDVCTGKIPPPYIDPEIRLDIDAWNEIDDLVAEILPLIYASEIGKKVGPLALINPLLASGLCSLLRNTLHTAPEFHLKVSTSGKLHEILKAVRSLAESMIQDEKKLYDSRN